MRPPCDVIDDVITMEIIFSKWPPHFELATNFLPEVILEVEYTRKMAINRAHTPKNEVFSSQYLMLLAERACSN